MSLQNKWVKLIDRSYSQMMDAIRTRFFYEIPEITDTSEAEKGIQLASISAGIGEQNNYFADNIARETFLEFCQLFASISRIAQSEDYRIKPGTAGRGYIALAIPTGTTQEYTFTYGAVIQDANGIPYTFVGDTTMPIGETFISLPVVQNGFDTDSFEGNGQPNQVYVLPANVIDVVVTRNIDDTLLLQVPSLSAYPTSGTTNAYIFEINQDGLPQIKFGDGVVGFTPNEILNIQLITSVFAEGNIIPNTAFTIPGIVDAYNAINIEQFTGGGPVDSIDTLRNKIKAFKSTNQRAVELDDYANVALLFPGVRTAKASLINTNNVLVTVYGNSTEVPDLEGLQLFIESYAMMGQVITVANADIIHVKQVWELNIAKGYSAFALANVFSRKVTDFYSIDVQPIQNDIQVSELYFLAQSIEGVNFATLKNIFVVPTLQPSGLTYTFDLNENNRETINWKIIFNSTTAFQLYKNNAYLMNCVVNIDYTLPEFIFNISGSTGSPDTGSTYTFTTYPNNASVVLQENAIATSFTADLTITTVGGY